MVRYLLYRNGIRYDLSMSEADFIAEREASVARQKKVEAEDSEPFEALLARHA